MTEINYTKIINEAFSFHKQNWFKYYLIQFLPLIALLFLGGFALILFFPLFNSLLGLNLVNLFSVLSLIIPIIIYVIISLIILILIGYYVTLIVYSFPLKQKGFEFKISFNLILRAFALNLASFLFVLFYPFSFKQRIIQWLLIILIILSIALLSFNLLFFIVLFFSIFLLLFLFIYNSIRFSQAFIVLLALNKSIFNCFKESWFLTEKKVLETLLALIIIFFIVAIIGGIVSFFMNLIIIPLMSSVMLSNNIFLAFSIVALIVFISFLIQPILALIKFFGLIELFNELFILKKK